MPIDSTDIPSVAASFPDDVKRAVSDSDKQRIANLKRLQDTHEQRQGALTLEASRLSVKYGQGSPQAQRAQALVEMHTVATAETKAMVQRAQAPPVTVGATEAVYYGRVLDDQGAPQCGFTVEGRDATGNVLGKGDTDRQGNYRAAIDTSGKSLDVKPPGAEGAPATHVPALKLVVVKSGRVWLQGTEELPINAGQAVYRELSVPSLGPCGDTGPGSPREDEPEDQGGGTTTDAKKPRRRKA